MIRYIDANITRKKPKATIHVTGKLGFNKDAQDLLKLERDTYFMVGIDEEGYKGKLYLNKVDSHNEKAAKTVKAGNYFYLNLAGLFDSLKIDYEKSIYAYDIETTKIDEGEIFVLKGRNPEMRERYISDKIDTQETDEDKDIR